MPARPATPSVSIADIQPYRSVLPENPFNLAKNSNQILHVFNR